jgi:DNA-binding MarR family transcriptional regulator
VEGPRKRAAGRRRRHPAVLAWLRLMRVYLLVGRAAGEHARAAGLSLAQLDVLAQVGALEGRTQRELADALLVTKGNVTQLLDRMEACGLLERRRSGRSKTVYLTPKGRALRERVIPRHEAMIADQFAALSAGEQGQLLRLLGIVERTLRPDWRAEAGAGASPSAGPPQVD